MMAELIEEAADWSDELEEMEETDVRTFAFRTHEGVFEGVVVCAKGAAARELLRVLSKAQQRSEQDVAEALASIERAEQRPPEPWYRRIFRRAR